MTRLITVFSASNSIEVYHKKAILEDYGIPCTIEDEHATQWAWHLSQAIGGIKLKVAEEDHQQAYRIIHGKKLETTSCPKCQSEDVYFDPFQKTLSILLSIFLFMFPFPVYKKNKWSCRACQHQWKN